MSGILKTLSKGKERIKAAFGKGDAAATGADPAALLNKSKDQFFVAHALAEKRVEEVKKTPGADRNDKVKALVQTASTLVTETKTLVQKATKPEEVDDQRKKLGGIYTAANKVLVAARGPENLADFEKARSTARETLGTMRQMPGALTEPFIVGVVAAADELLVKATSAAADAVNKEEVQAQIEALKGMSKLKDDAKRASDAFVKAAPKNLQEFEKKRTAASDRLAEVRALRGAIDDPNAANLLGNGDRILGDITKLARAAKNENEVSVQIKRLDAIELLAKKVETASADAKTRAKADVAAISKWTEELEKAQKARDALLDVAITREEYKELVNVIATAQLVAATGGTDAAVKELSAYSGIVQRAEDKQRKAKTQVPPPEVWKAAAAVEPFLKQLDTLAADYVAKTHRGESERLVFLGNAQPADAITGLGALLTTVQGEVRDVTQQKSDAERKLREYRTESGLLTKEGYRETFFALASQQADLAESTDIAGRDWGRANERLDSALTGIVNVRSEQGQAKKDWDASKSRRDAIRAYATKLIEWPSLGAEANKIIEKLRSVDAQFERTGNYATVQDLYLSFDLEQADADLHAAAQADAAMPDVDKLGEFGKGLRSARNSFHDAYELATKNLKALESRMTEMVDPTATKLHTDLGAVQTEWVALARKPTGGDPAALVAPFIARVQAISKEASGLLADPAKVASFQAESKDFDAKRPDGRLAASVGGMIDLLERADILLPAQRQRLSVLLRATTSEEERAKGLLALNDELKDRVAAEKKKELDRVAKTKEAVNRAVNEPLARIKGRHREFQAYQQDLEAEAGDLSAMAGSDDPYFLKMARQDTVSLAKKVAAVDPDQRGEKAIRYKEVEAKWDALRTGLDGGDMKTFMPATHETLRQELAGLIGETRHASPEDGLKMLADIEQRINAAKDRLATVKAEQEAYKKRRERLTRQWDQIKKDTRTRVTDRTTAFAAALEARLNEADAALKEENGAARAGAILQKLEDSLRQVEVSADPRAELQTMDAQVEREQRVIRDMARVFQEELKYFKETVIPRARALVKERAEAGKSALERGVGQVKAALGDVANTISKANAGGGDADRELLDSLEATLKNASRPVQPYLDMLSVTKIGAAKTPQLSSAQAAFQSARGMLSSAARTVDGLQSVTSTTSMSITQDLKKVEANWVEQAQNYAKTVQGMAAAIRDAAKGEADPAAKDAAEKAAKTVQDAAADFKPGAFALQIAVLNKKDTAENDKLAAREKALTTMRAFRKLLLEHPVHTRIADPANPFAEASKMRAAARGILVALKRIELETLIGV